jgi:hypothetical protein
MEILVQKYELEQDGKMYNISTQIFKDKLRLILEEANIDNSLIYTAIFTLNELMQLSSIFSSISSISEAQNIFENIIINQKITIEYHGEYINLKVGIKEKNIEEYFTIPLNLYNQNGSNTQKNSFQSININKSNSQDQISTQYFSSLTTNTEDNNQLFYSSDNTNQEYSIPFQDQSTENMIYNTNGNFYNYDNTQLQTEQSYNNNESLSPQEPEMNIEENSPAYPEDINEELENLRNENDKLNAIIIKLKNQIEILVHENNNLNLKLKKINNKKFLKDESQEIIVSRQEVEKYLNEIKNLRSKVNEYDEYKRIKEEETNSLKMKDKEILLMIQKKIEDYGKKNQKEIDEFKAFIDQLLQKQKLGQTQYQNIGLKQNYDINLGNQFLTLQDIRLEIIKGDIIEDIKELELLSRRISKNNSKIILNLLYKATIDSDKAEIFHKKCDFAKNTLVLVKSKNGKRFGGYTTQDWNGNSVEKKDDNAFVFSLDKMAIYDIIPGEDAIGCYPNYGPVFLGCQIRIYDEFFTKGGTTYEKGLNYNTQEDFELTGGQKKFEVKEIEVYSVDLE